jgi:hypothetical protein
MKLKRISMLLLFTAVLVFSGLVCNANYNLTAASGVYTLTVETGKNSTVPSVLFMVGLNQVQPAAKLPDWLL